MAVLFFLHSELCFCFQIGTVLALALTRELPVIVESINALQYHENLQLFAYWSFHESWTNLGWERILQKNKEYADQPTTQPRTVQSY
jgi:hypothetical protein